jgi:hypothetical protein
MARELLTHTANTPLPLYPLPCARVQSRPQSSPPTRQEPGPAQAATSVSIKELAEYLGHSVPAFTLRVYAHMLPCSHDRARAVISERFTRVIEPDS